MKPSVRLSLYVISAAAVLGVYACLPSRFVYWRSEDHIESFLRTQTPLGSSQSDVLDWLRRNGTPASIAVGVIPPGSSYPPTQIGGASFTHQAVAHYRILFATDVEAFYIFDATGSLVDLRVRTTVDAL